MGIQAGRRHRRRHGGRNQARTRRIGRDSWQSHGAAALARRNPPGTRIDVNTAATFLDYCRDGAHVDRRNVVAGEPDKPTPQLQARSSARREAKVAVPEGIGDKELANKGQAG